MRVQLLYDDHARFYDSALGRFVSVDTIVPELGDPQSFNRYSYVRNNPLKFIDPSGHIPTDGDGNRDFADWAWYKKYHRRRPLFEHLPVASDKVGWIQWFGGTEFAYNEGDDWNYDSYCQGFHCGLDLGADWGTSVRAGTWGKVVGVWSNDSDEKPAAFGRYRVDIRVGAWLIIFSHLDGDVKVKVGDFVSPDTIIAGVGNPAGNSSKGNKHIHIEVRLNNQKDQKGKTVDYIYNPLHFVLWRDFRALQEIAEDQDNDLVTFYETDEWVGYPDPWSQPIIKRGGSSL